MFSEKDLSRLDFNLLVLLKVLGEERNTHRTAERMFITQSAVSKGLKKARQQFNDELFVRTRYGLEPTEHCLRLLEQLPLVMEMISNLFEGSLSKLDNSYQGTITIATSPVMSQAFGRAIARHFSQELPNATLELINWQWQTEQDLINKRVHVGINYYPLDLSSDIYQHPCSKLSFKLCVRREHPLIQEDLTLAKISVWPLVLSILPDYTNHKNHVERIFQKLGYTTNVLFKSDQVDLCYKVVEETDAVFPISDIVNSEMPDSLVLLDLPEMESIPGEQLGLYYADSSKSSMLTQHIVDILQRLINR